VVIIKINKLTVYSFSTNRSSSVVIRKRINAALTRTSKLGLDLHSCIIKRFFYTCNGLKPSLWGEYCLNVIEFDLVYGIFTCQKIMLTIASECSGPEA
jgi:hypothetical protein